MPTGAELTERAFGGLFTAGALATVLRHHDQVGWRTSEPGRPRPDPAAKPRLPRLETVLEVAKRVHGADAIARLLADVADAEPNRLHRFFAAHLNAGGYHLTANFDGCIESAADLSFPSWRSRGQIYHFHGSLAEDPSGRSLGATLDQIQGGFDDQRTELLHEMLPSEGVLAIFGYSGSDFFDIDEAIAALPAGALADVQVVWVLHEPRGSWRRVDPANAGVPLAVHLARAGARVQLACGPTGDVIERVARSWRFALPGKAVPRTPRHPVLTNDDTKQQAATFLLYRELGLQVEVAAMLRAGEPPGTDRAAIWLARSEVLWEQGKWNRLRRLWQGPDVPAELRGSIRAERIGACLWVQGRMIPACLWLSWHRRRCQDADGQLSLAETLGRVIEHMERVPELRWLARRLAPRLIRIIGDTEQTAGVHLYRRRNDLISSLRSITGVPRAPLEASTSSQWFAEAGNVLAALSYRHRQYRDNYPSDAISDAELASRYRELGAHCASTGSRSGQLRTHLLPGAERVFTIPEVIAGVLSLQYGSWHRFRLTARFVLLRARHLMR